MTELVDELLGASFDPLAHPLSTSVHLLVGRMQAQQHEEPGELSLTLADLIEQVGRALNGESLPGMAVQTAHGPVQDTGGTDTPAVPDSPSDTQAPQQATPTPETPAIDSSGSGNTP
jgi:hypothetical protein